MNPAPMKALHLRLLAMALLVALAAMGPAVRGIAQRHREQVAMASTAEVTARNNNAFAMILGEFRASLSDFMFIKTERYLDSGVAYEPHIHLEEMVSEDRETNASLETHDDHAHDDHADRGHDHDHHDHAHTPTIIRTAQDDFRGVLGELERTVKPYRDPHLPHNHTTGEELLPWYRLMTLANPRQVRPYLIGAMWLSQQEGQLEAAIDFLEEGIRQNQGRPDLFRLYLGLTTSWVKFSHERPDASWADPALQSARRGFVLALHQREQTLAASPDRWRNDQEEDLRIVGHYVALLEQHQGNTGAALEAAEALHAVAPDFTPNARLLESLRQSSP